MTFNINLMNTLLYALILLPVFYILFKLLFVAAYTSYTDVNLFKDRREFYKFVFNPILVKKYSKDKYLKLYYYLSFILAISWGIVLSYKFNELIDILNINFTVGIIYILVLGVFISFLLYLSIFDVISFSIPEIISKRMLLFAAFANLLFLILRILLNNTEYSYIFGLIGLGSILNLLGGLIGGGVIWLIVKISKEKAMGAGDVDILAAIGLMLGMPAIFYSFYYTLIAASVISIVYALILRRFKGLIIPFVPFLSTGFILCLVLKDSVIRIFTLY